MQQVTLSVVAHDGSESSLDLLALDQALAQLEELSPRQAKLVELRFFGGMTVPEIAAALEVSTSTVEKEWRLVRAWLAREVAGAEA